MCIFGFICYVYHIGRGRGGGEPPFDMWVYAIYMNDNDRYPFLHLTPYIFSIFYFFTYYFFPIYFLPIKIFSNIFSRIIRYKVFS